LLMEIVLPFASEWISWPGGVDAPTGPLTSGTWVPGAA
jgi:hypothetical protein